MREHSWDVEGKIIRIMFSGIIAKVFAVWHVDVEQIGFGQPCLKFVQQQLTRKQGKTLHKKTEWHAIDARKLILYEEDEQEYDTEY